MSALEDVDIESINYAFKCWTKESTTMPTPADIYNIAFENMKHRNEMNNTNRAINTVPRPRAENMNRVAWYGMSWKEINASASATEAIDNHLVELTRLKGKQAAKEYLLYLRNGPCNKFI